MKFSELAKRAFLTGTVLLLQACPNATKEAGPDSTDGKGASNGAALITDLHVDPSLIDEGRVTLEKAVRVETINHQRVPAEVVAAPDGAAQVTSQIPGRIAALQANVGDQVQRGDVLLWLEAPEVALARAALATARAERDLAEKRMERQRQLERDGATSKAAFDEAQAALDSSEASLRSAALRLSAWGAEQGSGARYPLRSPIDGVVTDHHVVLGGAVAPGEVLFQVIAPRKVLVFARYPELERDIPPPLTEVGIWLRHSQEQPICKGKVETSTDAVDPATRTIKMRIVPDPDCTQLRQGTYVEVAPLHQTKEPPSDDDPMDTTERPTVIPAAAVVYVRGQPTVFVQQGAPGTFMARSVQLQSLDGDLAVLRGGVEPGESVVKKGTLLLKGEMLRNVLGGE